MAEVMAFSVKVDVYRSKAADELAENVSDLAELLDLVPSWQEAEAREIAQRILDRHKGWITIVKPK